ncbi:salicylate hydroxylase [Pseudohyphozyma bogoriensis]|nr:salicylate hydroxylase [Pseudohyphozyma bogoriensis]
MVGQPSTAPFRIAIVGGGIGGVVAAIAILKSTPEGVPSPFDVQIYESASAFAELGAGLSVTPNAIRALEMIAPELGASFREVVGKLGKQPDVWFDFTVGELKHPKHSSIFTTVSGPGAGQSVHRTELLNKLISHLPAGIAHFSHTCTNYEKTAKGITLSFTARDGSEAPEFSTVEADYVIGCDGIRSNMRRSIYEQRGLDLAKQELEYANWSLWRGIITREAFEKSFGVTDHEKMVHCGYGRHILHYPISQDNMFNVIAWVRDDDQTTRAGRTGPWSEYLDHETMLKDFEGFTPECIRLLKALEKPSRWGLFMLPELKVISDERIVLIGDAAHAMTAHCGAGAGSAMEDALVLATLLKTMITHTSHPTTKQLAQMTEIYERSRTPRGKQIADISAEAGLIAEFAGSKGEGDDVEKIAATSQVHVRKIWDWDTVGALKSAVEELKACW